MSALGVGIICRRNGKLLEDLLSQVIECGIEEIVLVDTEPGGSNDGTKEIAEKYNAKYILDPWDDNFGRSRNVAFSNVTSDYVCWLDTDDVIPEETQRALKHLVDSGSIYKYSGIHMPYEMWKDNIMQMSFPRERIISRKAYESGVKWVGAIHECMAFPADAVKIEYPIQHKPNEHKHHEPGRNLRILEKLYKQGDRNPRTLFYLGRELYWNGKYERAIKIFNRWLKMDPIDWERYSGTIELAQCYKLLGMEDKRLEALLMLAGDQPERAEAWVELGLIYYGRKEWQKALPFFKAAVGLPRPDYGFIDESKYGVVPYDYLATCFGWVGKNEEARMITQDILLMADPENERLLQNLALYDKVLSTSDDSERNT